MERGRKRRQLEEEALRWKREEERKALWAGSDADALLTDALKAQRRARETKFNRELRELIQQELAVSGEAEVLGVDSDRLGH